MRLGFIRKVYGLLCCMLGFTFSVVALFTLHAPTRIFVQATPSLLSLALALYIGTAVALTCCGEANRRTYPTNYILLGAFTASTSVLVGVAACAYSPMSVALASFYTFGIFAGLTAYAHTTKTDWTGAMAGAAGLGWGLVLLGVSLAFLPASSALHACMGLAGALLFSAFLVVDTQLLLTKMGPDDYVYAALQLYLDVVNLFLKILQLLGKRER